MLMRYRSEQAHIGLAASSPAMDMTSLAHGLDRETPPSLPRHVGRSLKLVSSDASGDGRAPPHGKNGARFASDAAASAVTPALAFGSTPKRPAQWLRNTAILFSFCLHGAIALTMIDGSDSSEQFGTRVGTIDAISVATEQTLVLESIETEMVQTAAAASAASQAGGVPAVESVPQPMIETKEAVEAVKPPPPRPDEVAKATPGTMIPTDDPLSVIRGAAASDEVREIKAIDPVETPDEVKPAQVATEEVEVEKEDRKADKTKKRHVAAQAESRASSAGGTTSRASAAQAAISGRVSASRGNVLNYAARIRTVLSRHKPAGDGHRGTARISFGVTASGDLSYVRIAASSGRVSLDQAALGAVRQAAPFGQPPDGVIPSDLRFTIPFYFR